MIRIVLADDHPVVREGIRGMLQGYDDIEVVGQAGSGPEAVALVAELHPDLVLMDLRMPGGDGVEATRAIVAAHPATRVVVLTTYETDQDILRAIEAGASGYLLKDIAPAELARSVRSAAAGQTVLATSAATALLGRVQGRQAAPALSAQEINVLRLAADGLHQRRHRIPAVHRRGDREDLPEPCLREARCLRPHVGGPPRPRTRPAGLTRTAE